MAGSLEKRSSGGAILGCRLRRGISGFIPGPQGLFDLSEPERVAEELKRLAVSPAATRVLSGAVLCCGVGWGSGAEVAPPVRATRRPRAWRARGAALGVSCRPPGLSRHACYVRHGTRSHATFLAPRALLGPKLGFRGAVPSQQPPSSLVEPPPGSGPGWGPRPAPGTPHPHGCAPPAAPCPPSPRGEGALGGRRMQGRGGSPDMGHSGSGVL